ncbi:hypothetical protein D3C79_747200 [compost metagenome]
MILIREREKTCSVVTVIDVQPVAIAGLKQPAHGASAFCVTIAVPTAGKASTLYASLQGGRFMQLGLRSEGKCVDVRVPCFLAIGIFGVFVGCKNMIRQLGAAHEFVMMDRVFFIPE